MFYTKNYFETPFSFALAWAAANALNRALRSCGWVCWTGTGIFRGILCYYFILLFLNVLYESFTW